MLVCCSLHRPSKGIETLGQLVIIWPDRGIMRWIPITLIVIEIGFITIVGMFLPPRRQRFAERIARRLMELSRDLAAGSGRAE